MPKDKFLFIKKRMNKEAQRPQSQALCALSASVFINFNYEISVF